VPSDKFKTMLGYGIIVLISIVAFWYGSMQRQARITRDATPSPSSEVVKVSLLSVTPSSVTTTPKATSKPTATPTPKATATPKATVKSTTTPAPTSKPTSKPTIAPTASPVPSVSPTQAPAVAGASSDMPTTGPLDGPFLGFLAMIAAVELYRRSRKNVPQIGARPLRTR
jgi:cytoskeletal protein RodZ